MISADTFMLANLALYVLLILGVLLVERRDRRWTYRWHRHVRTRRISTEEVVRMIDKATRRRLSP